MPANTTEQLGLLEETFRVVKRAESVDKKVRAAVKSKVLAKAKGAALYAAALEKSVITTEEHALLARAEELRSAAIQVDDFSQDEYLTHGRATAASSSLESVA
jgi:hypothetical protein